MILSNGTATQSWLTTEPALDLSSSVLVPWRAVAPVVAVTVTKVGERSESPPLIGQATIAA